MTEAVTTRCGFVAIIGRPNVGKSTLLNRLLGQKISITSRKPQTTRHSIIGIVTHEDVQTIYVDTPGVHIKAIRELNRQLNKIASTTLNDVDVVVFVINGLQWTDDDALVLSKLQHLKVPVILAVNKVDQIVDKARLLPLMEKYAEQYHYAACIPISALKGKAVHTLQAEVAKYLPVGPHLFPDEQITDRSTNFICSEIIREKLFRILGQELPYAIAVQIESYKVENNITHIHAIIWVEKESQKPIVIGKHGANLKNVGQQARLDIERNIEMKVNLQLWVKVRDSWADDQRALNELGYKEPE